MQKSPRSMSSSSHPVAKSCCGWWTPTAGPWPMPRSWRDSNRMFDTTPVHSDASGKCVVGGMSIEFATVVDIISMGRSLGATTEIPDAGSAGANNREIEVKLLPLVPLSGRVLDETGKPIVGCNR